MPDDCALWRVVVEAGAPTLDARGEPSYALLVRARAGAIAAAAPERGGDVAAADELRGGEPLRDSRAEAAALRAISGAARADLASAPTTLAHDAALIARASSAPLRLRLALPWRVLWKRALASRAASCPKGSAKRRRV